MIGDFPNLGEVCFNKDSIANILSLADVHKVCHITMDTNSEPAMHVHRLDGSIMIFKEHESGLYVYNPNITHDCINAYSMLSTVAAQKHMFSWREIKAADTSRELYQKTGRPDEAKFQTILQKNHIRNCPVTPADSQRALIIYGPDIAVVKGKTTQSNAAPHVPTFEAVPIPLPVLEHHRKITIYEDFFYVHRVQFFHSISRGIGFHTVNQSSTVTRVQFCRNLKPLSSFISIVDSTCVTYMWTRSLPVYMLICSLLSSTMFLLTAM